jgi:hypothetical protein
VCSELLTFFSLFLIFRKNEQPYIIPGLLLTKEEVVRFSHFFVVPIVYSFHGLQGEKSF